MSKFKVGDKVFSASHGWGVVMDIEEGEEYPVTVKSLADDSDLSIYTKDGRFYTGKGAPVSLFLENEVPEFYHKKEESTKKHEIENIFVEENPNYWTIHATDYSGRNLSLFTLNKNTLQWERSTYIPKEVGFDVDNVGKIIFKDEHSAEYTALYMAYTELCSILLDAENNKYSFQKPEGFNCAILSMEEYARLLEIEEHALKMTTLMIGQQK